MRAERPVGLVLAVFAIATGVGSVDLVAVPNVAVYHLDATPGDLSVLLVAWSLCALLGGWVGGWVFDRCGAALPVSLGTIACSLAILVLSGARSITSLAAGSGLLGFAALCVFTTLLALPPAMSAHPDRVSHLNGRLQAAQVGGYAVGPALAGMAARWLDVEETLFVGGSVIVLAGIAATALVRGVRRSSPGFTRATAPPTGWKLYGDRTSKAVLVLFTIQWGVLATQSSLEPLFLARTLRAGPETLGWANAAFALGVIAGGVALGRTRRSASVGLLSTGFAVIGVLAMLYGSSSTTTAVVLLSTLWGLVLGAVLPKVRTILQMRTAAGEQGRLSALLQSHQRLAEFFPLIVAPAAATAFGIRVPLVASGVALTLLGALAAAVSRSGVPRAPVPDTMRK